MRCQEGERHGYDTKNDTKVDSGTTVAEEVIEKNGRHEETRTPDLYRVKATAARNLLTLGGTDSQLRCP